MSFPRYPAYKPSGVEWLGEVPEHWESLRLRFAATLNPSKQEARSYADDDLVTFLPMEAIGEDGSLNLEQVKEVGECLNGYTYFKEGDVCIAKITPCFENGKGAILRDLKGGIGFGTTELIVARPRTEIMTAQFIDYVFRSSTFRSLGEAAMYGAGGQKRVPDSFVRDFASFLPPIAEQSAIAIFLDYETAKIDALITEQQRLIELLQEKRQAVISHAVTKGLNPDAPMKDSGVEWLGEVPEHWSVAQIRRYVQPARKITYGIVQPGEPDPNGIFMIRGQDYSGGWATPDSVFRVSPAVEQPYSRSRLKQGDLVMTIVGAGVGNTAKVPAWLDGANLTQTTCRIAVDESLINSDYMNFVLQSNVGKYCVGLYAKGAAQPGLNLEHVKTFPVTRPPFEEQLRIAGQLERVIASMDDLIKEANLAVELLAERRSALISAAVTGQIDVRGLAPETSAA